MPNISLSAQYNQKELNFAQVPIVCVCCPEAMFAFELAAHGAFVIGKALGDLEEGAGAAGQVAAGQGLLATWD